MHRSRGAFYTGNLRIQSFFLAAVWVVGSAFLGRVEAAPSDAAAQSQQLQYVSGLIDDNLFEAALKSLRELSTADEEDIANVFAMLARLYGSLGSIDKAKDFLEQANGLTIRSTPRVRLEEARLHVLSGNLLHARRSLEALEQLSNSEELIEDITLLKARAQLAVGGVERAHAVLESGPRVEPLLLERVKLLVAEGKFDQAVSMLEMQISQAPDSGRSLLKLGELERKVGNSAKADQWLTSAKAIFERRGDIARQNETVRLMTSLGTQTTPQNKDDTTEKDVKKSVVGGVPPTNRLRTPEAPPANESNRAPKASAPLASQAANSDEVGKVIARPFPFPPTVELTTGSGFVIDGGRRVITNKHVVEGVSEIYVRNSLGDLSRAKVERLAGSDDLAVLILETAFPRKRSIMENQFAQARAGVSIAVIGFPMTDVLGSVTPSITNGIVTKATGMQDAPEMFQLSAKMNKGNSGGAVVDLRGRVVGVAMGKLDTVKIMQSGGFLPEDINFAIHVNRLMPLGVQSGGNEQGALADMSLEEIYQRFIGSVVMIAGR